MQRHSRTVVRDPARLIGAGRGGGHGFLLLRLSICGVYRMHMKSFVEEFKKFALRGNAVDLAVGVVIGASFNTVTTSLVNNVLTPPLSLLTRGINFGDLAVAIPHTDAAIQYGIFIQTVISFLITAFALFLLVKAMNRMAAAARKEQAEGKTATEEKSAELLVLEQIRDSIKK